MIWARARLDRGPVCAVLQNLLFLFNCGNSNPVWGIQTGRNLRVVVVVVVFNYFFLFRKRGREGETEGEKHLSVASRAPPTGDLARNPGMCPDWESNL